MIKDAKQFDANNSLDKKSKGHKTIWCKKFSQNSVSNSQDIIDLDKCPPGQMLPEQMSS